MLQPAPARASDGRRVEPSCTWLTTIVCSWLRLFLLKDGEGWGDIVVVLVLSDVIHVVWPEARLSPCTERRALAATTCPPLFTSMSSSKVCSATCYDAFLDPCFSFVVHLYMPFGLRWLPEPVHSSSGQLRLSLAFLISYLASIVHISPGLESFWSSS